jgi:tRNA nucleotidyltransferase (CCA-adding enzyme)
MRIKLTKDLKQLASHFKAKGFQCYIVGGAIRNLLLGKKINDFDIATDALPEQVNQLFRKVIPTGIQHGTVTVLFKTHQFEVTTFRIDGEYTNHRKPDKVEFSPSLYEDLKRRDFTINALAYDINTHTMYDPVDGKSDLKNKIIRAIGNPILRFEEDALRTLRACRFACVLDFTIEDDTLSAIAQTAHLIKKISHERIRDELLKILEAQTPSRGFEFLRKTGLMQHILPELLACKDIKQPALHCFDVYYHSLYSCDAASQSEFTVRLAALFHDIGKPASITHNENNEIRFYSHEKKSKQLAYKILKRLKFPNAIIENTCHLILHHMFSYDGTWTDAAVRRFIRRVGITHIDDLFALRKADQIGMCHQAVVSSNLMRFRARIEEVLQKNAVFSVQDLCINGHDLMKKLNISQSVYVGKILDYLLECVLDDPTLNTRETLLEIARRFYEQRLKTFLT